MTRALSVFILLLSWAASSSAYTPYGDIINQEILIPYYDQEPVLLSYLAPADMNDGAWKSFVQSHGPWAARINALTGMIHRAWGGSVYVGTPQTEQEAIAIALNFLSSNMALARIPSENLVPIISRHRGHHWYVDFRQQYQGLEVFGSHVAVRISDRGNVVLFECGYFPNIDIPAFPVLSADAAELSAGSGVIGFLDATVPQLVIFPLPSGDRFEYRLAYELDVATNEPARFLSVVDADSGELLYRKNVMRYITADGFLSGMIYPVSPFDIPISRPFELETVNITGVNPVDSDTNGFFSVEVPDQQARALTTRLRGPFVNVLNYQGTEASFNGNITPGDTLRFTWIATNSRADERNCFYHVNIIHDYMKAIDPDFTDLDFSMVCNVNLNETCNAYYDPSQSSINFFMSGGGCSNTGEIADVIYHEYGHGVSDYVYRPSSPSGAQHEGWSDYIAATITNQPLIGRGFYSGDPNSSIRTVDNNMFWPDSLTGEPHNDGLIVAGALWDLREALSPRTGYCDSLFHFARFGLSATFQDYLVDILTYDDDDDDLFNGSPNWLAISNSFDLHGLSLPPIAIAHLPLDDTNDSSNPYPVAITIGISEIPANQDSIFVKYRTHQGGLFSDILMSPGIDPGSYGCVIPAQPFGTLIEYYISVYDLNGEEYTSPATAPQPTYFFIVGQPQIQFADSLEQESGWTVGAPGDDATTGIWEQVDPNGTYADSDPTYPYQPEDDHTADPAVYCFVTGQHPLGDPNNGANDVDGGRTTLISPIYDLSSYENPMVEYYRWFTTKLNVNDTFYVDISSDGGASWTPLEILTTTENFWKKSRFLVSQLFTQLNQVRLRFAATDEGEASLVEGAVDDLTLYSFATTSAGEKVELPKAFTVRQNFPNPFNAQTEISFDLPLASDVVLSVYDISGRLVASRYFPSISPGTHTIIWDSADITGHDLPSGIYLYRLQAGQKANTRKMVLLK